MLVVRKCRLGRNFAPEGNAVKHFDATRLASGRSLRDRRCSLRELYGTYANLSLIEQRLPGGGLTPTGMRVRIAERSTTKMRSFAERTATYGENRHPRRDLMDQRDTQPQSSSVRVPQRGMSH